LCKSRFEQFRVEEDLVDHVACLGLDAGLL